MLWPDAAIEQLRELHGKMSFSEIAVQINATHHLGFSRNAIIGKAGRLGLFMSAPARVQKFRENGRKRARFS